MCAVLGQLECIAAAETIAGIASAVQILSGGLLVVKECSAGATTGCGAALVGEALSVGGMLANTALPVAALPKWQPQAVRLTAKLIGTVLGLDIKRFKEASE